MPYNKYLPIKSFEIWTTFFSTFGGKENKQKKVDSLDINHTRITVKKYYSEEKILLKLDLLKKYCGVAQNVLS